MICPKKNIQDYERLQERRSWRFSSKASNRGGHGTEIERKGDLFMDVYALMK
jgi:hypothetical protein